MYHRGISQPSQSRALEFLPPQLSSSSTELTRSYADILNSKKLNENVEIVLKIGNILYATLCSRRSNNDPTWPYLLNRPRGKCDKPKAKNYFLVWPTCQLRDIRIKPFLGLGIIDVKLEFKCKLQNIYGHYSRKVTKSPKTWFSNWFSRAFWQLPKQNFTILTENTKKWCLLSDLIFSNLVTEVRGSWVWTKNKCWNSRNFGKKLFSTFAFWVVAPVTCRGDAML